jgi:hypothetical protein
MADDAVMQIALVLYPRFTALDIVGPFQTIAQAQVGQGDPTPTWTAVWP